MCPSSGEGGGETPILLSPSERANLNHWTAGKTPWTGDQLPTPRTITVIVNRVTKYSYTKNKGM
jgi:hypothetical protein